MLEELLEELLGELEEATFCFTFRADGLEALEELDEPALRSIT